MSKYKKRLLLGLGITTLLTMLASPTVYYEFKAQQFITSKKYKEAATVYKNLSFISPRYLDRIAICYYKYFNKNYKENKHNYFQHEFTSNPILKKLPSSSEFYFKVKNKNSTASQIFEVFKKTSMYIKSNDKYLKGFSPEKSNKDIKEILSITSSLPMKDKKYFEESIKALEIAIYAENTKLAINGGQTQKALHYLERLENKYNVLHTAKTSPITKKLIQYNVLKTYYHYKKPISPNKKELLFEKAILNTIRNVIKDNKNLKKVYTSYFSFKHLFPFRSKKEIKNTYPNYLKVYNDQSKSSFFFHRELRVVFAQLCYTLQEEYIQIDPKFSMLSDIHRIIKNSKINDNQKAQELFELSKEFSKKQEYPLHEITAILSIQHQHSFALQHIKEENYFIAQKHFDVASTIYKTYSSISSNRFTTLYQDIYKHSIKIMSYSPSNLEKKKIKDSLLKSIK